MEPITVSQLIKILQDYNPEKTVWVEGCRSALPILAVTTFRNARDKKKAILLMKQSCACASCSNCTDTSNNV